MNLTYHTSNEMDSTKVFFVKGISRFLTEDLISVYFSAFGEAKVIIERDKFNRSFGYGWLSLSHPDTKLDSINPHMIEGNEIQISECHENRQEILDEKFLCSRKINDSGCGSSRNISSKMTCKVECTDSIYSMQNKNMENKVEKKFPVQLSTFREYVCIPLNRCPDHYLQNPNIFFAAPVAGGKLERRSPPWVKGI